MATQSTDPHWGTTEGREGRSDGMAGGSGADEAEPDVETFEEWRVTGDPGHGYPLYDFTWSPERGNNAKDPEGAARKFVARLAEHDSEWADGPHLSMRTVTRTRWKDVAP